MDEAEKAGVRFADMATLLANTRAITTLCNMLAITGKISERDFERIRHAHLDQFDQIFASEPLPPALSAALEGRRATIEEMWDVRASIQTTSGKA